MEFAGILDASMPLAALTVSSFGSLIISKSDGDHLSCALRENTSSSSCTFALNYIAPILSWEDMLLRYLLSLEFALTQSCALSRTHVICEA